MKPLGQLLSELLSEAQCELYQSLNAIVLKTNKNKITLANRLHNLMGFSGFNLVQKWTLCKAVLKQLLSSVYFLNRRGTTLIIQSQNLLGQGFLKTAFWHRTTGF